MNKVYNPLDNSPRGAESRQIPGPGEYKFKNMTVGTEGRHFSFLRRTKHSQGKSALAFFPLSALLQALQAPGIMLSLTKTQGLAITLAHPSSRESHSYLTSDVSKRGN